MHSPATPPTSNAMLWTGRILSALVILLMLFDAAIKLLKTQAAMQGTVQVGYPASTVFPIGLTALICIVLYAIPRTAVLGAILLTGYLGGAVATNVRISHPFGYIMLPVLVGAVVWGGLYFRDESLRHLIPISRA